MTGEYENLVSRIQEISKETMAQKDTPKIIPILEKFSGVAYEYTQNYNQFSDNQKNELHQLLDVTYRYIIEVRLEIDKTQDFLRVVSRRM